MAFEEDLEDEIEKIDQRMASLQGIAESGLVEIFYTQKQLVEGVF